MTKPRKKPSGISDTTEKKWPSTYNMKLDATPEEVAKAIFANAKRPDPKRRRGAANTRAGIRSSTPKIDP